MSRTVKVTVTERLMVFEGGRGRWGIRGEGRDGLTLFRLNSLDLAQLYTYPKKHQTVHCRWVRFMAFQYVPIHLFANSSYLGDCFAHLLC